MSITKIIKNLVVPELNKYGFKYLGIEAKSRWLFEKKIENISQYIIFNKSIYHKAFNVELSLEKYPMQRYCRLNELIGSEQKIWWEYMDDGELESVILELNKIVIEKGIDFLNLLSMPNIYPEFELSKELYNNHQDLFDLFNKNYRYVMDDYGKNDFEIAKGIDSIIRSRCKYSLEDNKQIFLEIAAICGTMVKNKTQGEWIFNELENRCLVSAKGRKKFEPLYLVLNYWNADIELNSFSYFWHIVNQPL